MGFIQRTHNQHNYLHTHTQGQTYILCNDCEILVTTISCKDIVWMLQTKRWRDHRGTYQVRVNIVQPQQRWTALQRNIRNASLTASLCHLRPAGQHCTHPHVFYAHVLGTCYLTHGHTTYDGWSDADDGRSDACDGRANAYGWPTRYDAKPNREHAHADGSDGDEYGNVRTGESILIDCLWLWFDGSSSHKLTYLHQ